MNLKDKKVLVIGYARSGKAAIRVLNKLGARITLSERKEITEDREFLDSLNVEVVKQEDSVFERDFDLVVKNPGVPPVSPIVKRLNERNIPIITEIELAYQVSKPQHYVAITGTNGKTTTTTLTYEILKNAFGEKAHAGGNIGTPLCELVMDYNLMEEEGHYISLEISNHQLVDIADFKPEVSVIINLTPDHLETMGSLDAYYKSKTEVYRNTDKNDIYLLNKDDEVLKEYIEKYPVNATVKTFSLLEKADSYIDEEYMYIYGEKVLALKDVKLVGKHNLQNIIISASACKTLGVSNQIIEETVRNFMGVEHRIEFVREIDGVRYYNDSKGTNTDATITALKAFDKGVILLVGGYEKGLSMDEMKKYLGPVKKVIGYGAAGKRIAGDLVGEEATIVNDLNQAVSLARDLAVSGDTVLLSPTTSSYDQYKSYEERGRHFKSIVNSL